MGFTEIPESQIREEIRIFCQKVGWQDEPIRKMVPFNPTEQDIDKILEEIKSHVAAKDFSEIYEACQKMHEGAAPDCDGCVVQKDCVKFRVKLN